MAAVRTGFADINGAKIYYEVAGEGQPFLMVHAGIADKSMWDAQFDFFARDYQVVRYDMRGFGQSPPVADDYQRHEDMRALLDFQVLLAPVNALMYLFSRTPRGAYIDPREFPEMKVLTDNWQLIR